MSRRAFLALSGAFLLEDITPDAMERVWKQREGPERIWTKYPLAAFLGVDGLAYRMRSATYTKTGDLYIASLGYDVAPLTDNLLDEKGGYRTDRVEKPENVVWKPPVHRRVVLLTQAEFEQYRSDAEKTPPKAQNFSLPGGAVLAEQRTIENDALLALSDRLEGLPSDVHGLYDHLTELGATLRPDRLLADDRARDIDALIRTRWPNGKPGKEEKDYAYYRDLQNRHTREYVDPFFDETDVPREYRETLSYFSSLRGGLHNPVSEMDPAFIDRARAQGARMKSIFHVIAQKPSK